MTVEILRSTDDEMLVHWKDNSGFGQILITYDEKGRYTIDAEYIGMDKLVKIMKAVAEQHDKIIIKLDDDD